MSFDKHETAIHEAGHAILARLTDKAGVYEIYVERRLPVEPWDGHMAFTWNKGAEVTAEDAVGVAYGGPCAEMKYVANKNSDVLWCFDLDDDSAEAFLNPIEVADGVITVRFRTADGQTKEVKFEHGPFGTDRNMAREHSDDDAFHVAQYRRVRELLNEGANWTAVKHLGTAVAESPPFRSPARSYGDRTSRRRSTRHSRYQPKVAEWHGGRAHLIGTRRSMTVRKYLSEFAVNMQANQVLVMLPTYLEHLSEEYFRPPFQCHIYGIARRPRVVFDPETLVITPEVIRGTVVAPRPLPLVYLEILPGRSAVKAPCPLRHYHSHRPAALCRPRWPTLARYVPVRIIHPVGQRRDRWPHGGPGRGFPG